MCSRLRLRHGVIGVLLASALLVGVVAGVAIDRSRSGGESLTDSSEHLTSDRPIAPDGDPGDRVAPAIDSVDDGSPGGLSRFITRVASAIGVDRLGQVTGGLIDAEVGDGRIAFRVDTDAPIQSLTRALQGVRQFAGDVAAHAQALVTGRPDAIVRIVAQNGQVVVPIADDGTLSLEELVATNVDPFATADLPLFSHGDASSASEGFGEFGPFLGDAVVLLVQGARDAELDFDSPDFRERPDRTPCESWGAVTPALIQNGHRVVVLEERCGDATAACVRIASVLGALREIGITDVDVVARRSGTTVVERYLRHAFAETAVGRCTAGADDAKSADHAGAPTGRQNEATILRRVVMIGGCVDDAAPGVLAKRRAFDVVTERRRVPRSWRGSLRPANRDDDGERACVEIVRVVASAGNALHQAAADRTRIMHLQSPRPQPSAMLDAVLAILATPATLPAGPAPDRAPSALAAADCLADNHSH